MGLELQIHPLYNKELRQNPKRKEILDILNMNNIDNINSEETNIEKKKSIEELEGKLAYDFDFLNKGGRMCFMLEGDIVAYMQIEINRAARNSVSLIFFRTSNNINEKKQFLLPQLIKLPIDQEYEIIEKKIPYLGTVILAKFFQEWCSEIGIENVVFKAIGGSEDFYIKTLSYLQEIGCVESFEEDENEFDVYL